MRWIRLELIGRTLDKIVEEILLCFLTPKENKMQVFIYLTFVSKLFRYLHLKQLYYAIVNVLRPIKSNTKLRYNLDIIFSAVPASWVDNSAISNKQTALKNGFKIEERLAIRTDSNLHVMI